MERCYNHDGTIDLVDETYEYNSDGDLVYVEALAALCVDEVTRTICDASWSDDLASQFCAASGYGGEQYSGFYVSVFCMVYEESKRCSKFM